jgi:class 3 adenylate cyclase/predicted ATPase
MTCPRCRHENEAGAKFCEECAAPLARACAKCGRPLSATAKFCPECAHPTGPSAAPAPAQRFGSPDSYTPKHLAERILTSKAALEGERKQVTVLFADLKGSMELLADRDPEDARKLLDPVLERMMNAVHRYEGTVNQVMGDGIMALFGAPLAHEDHAVRACYAALRMQETVKQYAEEVHRTQGIPLQIRVGLNSGEVVVRSIGSDLHMDYTAVGQTTHLAARMEQAAMPGAILISPETLSLAEGYVMVKSLGPIPIRGLPAPVEVFEVVGAATVRSRLQAAAARGLTRFVGRVAEINELRQALERAKTGHGQLVAVVGEPGVGKSRLFWEFTHSHRTQGWLIVESSSVSYGKATAFLPLVDLLRTYFQIEGRDEARKIREKVTGKLLSLDRTLAPFLPALLWLLDIPVEDPQWQRLDPPQRRQQTLDGIKRLLLRESQVQPLLVLFEDLHWIDEETQALLDSLVESLPTARLLLLVNYRPEYQHAWGDKTYYRQLRIDPLPPESVDELLEVLVGRDAGLAPLKRLLVERTEGNPFFLEESIRALVETKALVGERGAYRLAKMAQTLQIPATAQAILAARIDRLSPEDKRLLQAASVLGKDVPFALLPAVAEGSEEELRSCLSHLQAAEFLYEARLFPDLEYTFKHALTQEVAYNTVLQERRRVLHECAAQAIERLFAERLPEHYNELAHHYSRSGNIARAADYLQRAGQQAVERSAYAEAIRQLSTAVALLEPLPNTPERDRQELVVQMTLGPALMATKGGGAPEVERLYTRARELCERVGEPSELFRVLWGVWYGYNVRGEYQRARELGEQLLSLAEHVRDPDLLLEAHHALWAILFYGGELAAARPHLEQGLRLYEPKRHRSHAASYTGHDPGVCCRIVAAQSLWLLGYPDQAVASSQASLDLAQQLGHPFSLVVALGFAAMLHHCRREAPLTQARAEAAITLATEQDFPQQLERARSLRGWALAARGHGEEGIALIREALTSGRSTGATRDRPYNLALLAEASAQVGQTTEGLETLAEALAILAESGVRWWEAELYRLWGELLLSAERGVQNAGLTAEECFHQALNIARRQQAKSLELRAAMSLSRLWQHQGKRGAARDLLAPIYGWFTEGFDTADLRTAKALLDELSAA